MQYHHHMKRITTTVDPATYARLEDLARRDRVPAARLLREAMERYVTDRELELEAQPLPDWVGMFHGGAEPVAERAEEILREVADEIYRTELRGEPKLPRAADAGHSR
jgi:hypothetical protein